ncbi:MAG: deoxyguanosinetriphosphate triphosphohydrolase [Clostridiales bacterium]|nr:deoxyguanosinetriphosphate triphosphohydrolase [Clostridiales bacterium]
MTDRAQLEQREALFLAPHATFSGRSEGRLRPERPCDLRTDFMRDRDRIIHSKSFRRLKHKTQVFLSPEGDHYRTRLTHTLEVAQIARTLARAMGLNEDLTEAISLGHDLGHTPFGHSGEQELDCIAQGGFTHYAQSLRVVDVLERDRQGLNLTAEVRDGIFCHSIEDAAKTPEGRLVYWADHIAYVNHDIDDALRAGVLRRQDLPASTFAVLGEGHSARIDRMIRSLIEGSEGPALRMTAPVRAAYEELHDFLFDQVYYNPVAKAEEHKAKRVIATLFAHFMEAPARLPAEYAAHIDGDGLERVVLDYISGMTDRYCIALFEEFFVPKVWR